MTVGIRHRSNKHGIEKVDEKEGDELCRMPSGKQHQDDNKANEKSSKLTRDVESGTYWLTRVLYLRYLAFIYFIAFLVALKQNKQLIGKQGLLPANKFIEQINAHFGNDVKASFYAVPSLLIFLDKESIDTWLDAIAYLGIALSLIVFICGGSNILVMVLLWLLYHSLVNVGQRWYSFGWESQLLETGFLAIMFCPLFSMQKYPTDTSPSWVAIYGNRWLIFRIMLGAGLIKIRGDKCWRDLTCMNYHYQTQPVPNPVSYYLHQSPEVIHKIETLGNHFVELVAPFLLFLPRPFRITGGIIQILFQVILIISGNLSFLNWLTILPSLCCLDDKLLLAIFPSSRAKRNVQNCQMARGANETDLTKWGKSVRKVYEIMIALLIGYLSIPVVKNLFSSNQAMNTSFDSFRIVNTYGAFGSVTKTRTEVVIQGTRNESIIPDELGGRWHEYEFKCKPGDVKRRPCLISPYHYRLDWLMWFAAFQNYQYNPWLIHLAAKLLANRKEAESLLQHNPFKNGKPPRYVRAEHYLYEFTKIGSQEAARGLWWKRKKIGEYFPIVDLESLKSYLKANGWNLPAIEDG
ncbi:lipase maturation factor 1-like [Rhopilema esculentum]|uniref:lipase maturation factor 1-like n=1 Tax=Rhopilema esculentum TaxID=499914 RepID=UPI0031E421DD|eukprot:gene9316-17015_t